MDIKDSDIEERRMVTRPHEYDGSLTAIWELLRSLDKKVDLHLQEEAEVRPKLLELIDILTASKGLLIVLKWTSAVVVSIASAWVFLSKYFTYKGV